jgi:hypothetical protein
MSVNVTLKLDLKNLSINDLKPVNVAWTASDLMLFLPWGFTVVWEVVLY